MSADREGWSNCANPCAAGSVCLLPRTTVVSSGSSRTGREIALTMAAGSGARGAALCCVALVLLLVPAVSAFYLPGVAPQDFAQVSAMLQTAMWTLHSVFIASCAVFENSFCISPHRFLLSVVVLSLLLINLKMRLISCGLCDSCLCWIILPFPAISDAVLKEQVRASLFFAIRFVIWKSSFCLRSWRSFS